MNYRHKKVGEILLERKLITLEQLQEALQIQRKTAKKIGSIFVEKGWLTEDQLLDALSVKLNLPKVRIDSYTVDPTILNTVPVELARRYKVLPLFKVEDSLTVAMADPTDVFAIDTLRYHTGCKIQEVLTTEKDIDQAIQKYYTARDSMNEVIRDLGDVEVVEEEETVQEQELLTAAEDKSVIKLVNLIISQAIREKASDIHIEPDEGVLRIRYRIDGILREVSAPPKNLQPMIVARIKIMSNMDVAERRLPQDGRFRINVDGKSIDVRVSSLPTVHGEKIVMRVLDKSSLLIKLEDMGFSEETLIRWRSVIHKPEGILLITGPTGSGKTSTLYAVLNEINTPEKNIVTVENPVEYKFPLINQVQTNEKTGLTFAVGLRSILRQDPDIIMIGEIRDLETAEIAIRSSLTGHLVLSTLHTNDAPGAISRLIDMGVEPFLVASSLVAVLAQRLVRKICSHCRVPYQSNDRVLGPQGATLYKGQGCRECRKSGYRGRTGIFELMLIDDDLRRLILRRASSEEIKELARAKGMTLLREDGLRKAREGITTIEEVMRVA